MSRPLRAALTALDGVVIRPITGSPADYAALEAGERAVWPDTFFVADEIRYEDDARDPSHFFRRFLVEHDGTLVGYGHYCQAYWFNDPHQYALSVNILPAWQGRGWGRAAYDWVCARLAQQGAQALIVHTREDQPRALRFLADRGYRLTQRSVVSQLDVAAFDFGRFADHDAQMRTQGITQYSYAELAAVDSAWQHKFADLFWLVRQDIPSTGEKQRFTFEEVRRIWLEAPNVDHNSCFIAVDGSAPDGPYVGLSTLWLAPGEPTKLYTGVTGVVRSHRRRGIATALKLRGIAFARDYGATVLEADNDENNPMYQLNLALGFAPRPAWVEFNRTFAAADDT